MILSRQLSIAITVFAVFFLTFLGMRLPFLEKSSKPKPRPRAVLKLSGKQLTSFSFRFNDHDQSYDINVDVPGFALSPPSQVKLNTLLVINISASSVHSCPNGRSPPLC